MPLRRVTSDWAIPVGLACMVVAFAAGSGSEPWFKRVGLDARWIVLVIVCAAALLDAAYRISRTHVLPSRGLRRFGAVTGSFLALAIISTAWSVTPRLTFERAGSLAIVFLLGAALAASTTSDVAARARLFQGLAVGAVTVGVLGLFVLVFDYNTAVLREAGAWRYRGFTENPNTIAILAAAALPLNLGFALRATSRRGQAVWLAGGLLLVGSIIASESRGGLLAACAGTLLVSAFGVEGLRQRVAAITAVALVFAGGIALREAVQPPPTPFSSQVAPAPTPPVQGPTPPKVNPTPRHIAPAVGKTSELPREEDEIGSPALSKQATTTLASGRLAAWKGALDLVGDRPILGYGFGTEQKVFVDRWYYFQGGTAENSYLGLLLQLGTVGLAFILALGCALVAGGLRAVRLMRGDERLLVLMELGVLVGAAAIMLIQSYLYSVGNVATATVWISLFALATVALEPRPAARRIRATAAEEAS
jgi:O-antigen ligase/polysaccharide polymerase Wzy-like membrane protein